MNLGVGVLTVLLYIYYLLYLIFINREDRVVIYVIVYVYMGGLMLLSCLFREAL